MIIRTEGKERHNYLLNRKKISLLIFALFLIFSSTMVSNLINKTNTQWEWVIKPSLYKDISFLEGNLFKFYKNSGEVCIIDASTKDIYEYPLFDDIDFDRENVFIANKNSSFSMLTKQATSYRIKLMKTYILLKMVYQQLSLRVCGDS